MPVLVPVEDFLAMGAMEPSTAVDMRGDTIVEGGEALLQDISIHPMMHMEEVKNTSFCSAVYPTS